MRLVASLLIALVLCSCAGPREVSPSEFKRQYTAVGVPQTVNAVTYLGRRDGRAFIRESSKSLVTGKWSERVIYVDLAELDPEFRDALPKREVQESRFLEDCN